MPVIDTLEFSRRMYPSLKSHRLGAVCKSLGISLKNAHRAVHDARATALMLIRMLDTAAEKGVTRICDINSALTGGAIGDSYHIILLAAEQDGKIWFCTATTKDVWDELVANPKFEATAWWPGHGWLILRGRAGLEDKVNDDIRYAGFAHLSGLGETYDGPNDPTLTFFSVEEPQAWICNHEEWVPVEL